MLPKETVYLLDLDDTLLDTAKSKHDLFSSLAKVINPAGSYKESVPKIKELYQLFCQRQNGIYDSRVFCDFLSQHFGYQAEISACFKINYADYVLPNARELLKELKQRGKVIIWTTGAYEDQLNKLTQAGLLRFNKEQPNILTSSDVENNLTALSNPELAIVDVGKIDQPEGRLAFFLSNFPENPLTVIDNQSSLINRIVKINNPRLHGIWFDNGKQKDEQVAQRLRETTNPRFSRFSSLADLRQSLKPLEGVVLSPEQKG